MSGVVDRVEPARLIALLEEAVAAYSPAFGEGPVAAVFAAALTAGGIAFERRPVPGPAGARDRVNLVARLGPDPVGLHLVGHLDTIVLTHDASLGPRREGERLFGLGTADMKSGCAAMVEALRAVKASGTPLSRGVRVSLVVGEEEYGDGVEALLAQGLGEVPLTVVGEPTGLAPCLRHNGYLELELAGEGTRAHAALPEVGDNAVEATLDWAQASVRAIRALRDPDPAAVTLRQVRGGSALFVVPDRCEVALDVHQPPGVGPEAVEAAVEQAREAVTRRRPGCTLSAARVYWSEGYAVDPDDPRLGPLRESFDARGMDWRPGTFPSHSDASLLHRAGSATVVFGPGRLEVAHTPGEHVALPEVVEAARLYAELIRRACGAPAPRPGRAPA